MTRPGDLNLGKGEEGGVSFQEKYQVPNEQLIISIWIEIYIVLGCPTSLLSRPEIGEFLGSSTLSIPLMKVNLALGIPMDRLAYKRTVPGSLVCLEIYQTFVTFVKFHFFE